MYRKAGNFSPGGGGGFALLTSELSSFHLYTVVPTSRVQEYPAPLSLGEGARLRVYGGTFQQFSQKKEAMEPAITVSQSNCLLPLGYICVA